MTEKAKILAEDLHKNQKRKFDNSPYIVHPIRVAERIIEVKGDSKNIDALKSASYLHDSIEDCNISFDYLQKEFGYMVASIVKEVTNNFYLLKKYGKKYYMANKVLTLSSYGLVVKLADRLDNVSDLEIANPEFREKYTKETDYMIQVLQDFRNLTNTQLKLIKLIKEKIY